MLKLPLLLAQAKTAKIKEEVKTEVKVANRTENRTAATAIKHVLTPFQPGGSMPEKNHLSLDQAQMPRKIFRGPILKI